MDDTARRMSDAENTRATGEDLDEVSASKAGEIRSEIAQTREDMAETIDAIQEKLRPGNIAAAASDRMKDVTGTAVRNVAEAASDKAQRAMERTRRIADDLADGGRMNTIASAMIGIGSAWLLMERWRNSGRRRFGSMSEYEYGDERYRTRWARQPGVEQYDAHSASDEGVVSQSYNRAASMAHEARYRAKETTRRARSGFAHLLESNPLMVGAAAMAVGATIGLALPETERENEWMGEARDNLMDRAQDVARSTVTEVRQAAGDIAGQVTSEVLRGEKTD
jgi:cell division septum initiation protein DivIVA